MASGDEARAPGARPSSVSVGGTCGDDSMSPTASDPATAGDWAGLLGPEEELIEGEDSAPNSREGSSASCILTSGVTSGCWTSALGSMSAVTLKESRGGFSGGNA